MSHSRLQRAGDPAETTGAWVRRLWRAALLVLLLLAGSAAANADGPDQRFTLDQRFGSIGFSVSHLGLFSSQGSFQRFMAHLVLNSTNPERTRISVAVDAGSLNMSWAEGAELLRSVDFFDVRQFPEVRFSSTSVERVSPRHFVIQGMLQMRGVTRPLTLRATLEASSIDPADHSGLADFIVRGSLKRSAFGMTADQAFISDSVSIVIKAHLQLPKSPDAG